MNIYISNYDNYDVSFDTHGGHPGIEIYKTGPGEPKDRLVARFEVDSPSEAGATARLLSQKFMALHKALDPRVKQVEGK